MELIFVRYTAANQRYTTALIHNAALISHALHRYFIYVVTAPTEKVSSPRLAPTRAGVKSVLPPIRENTPDVSG